MLVIVGGPQTRVGSHRQFVLLARALAAAGFPTLRFDYRGMGDSAGDTRTFEDIRADISAAMDALQRETGVGRVVLWGLCDGASAAWMDGADDPRVAGIVALNPWARSPQGEAATRLKHYYLQRLARAGVSGARCCAGGFRWASARGNWPAPCKVPRGPAAEARSSTCKGWRMVGGDALRRSSSSSVATTTRRGSSKAGWTRARQEGAASRRVPHLRLPEADHTFSSHETRERVARLTIEWLKNFALDRVLP